MFFGREVPEGVYTAEQNKRPGMGYWGAARNYGRGAHPQDMARMLLRIGQFIDARDRFKPMGEVGGRIPVEGPMGGGGGGKVTQMPTQADVAFRRAQQAHEAETARRIAERQAARGITPDQAKYDQAVGRQQVERTAPFPSSPFRNMSEGLWAKMPAEQRSAWLRDANWQSWPVEHQRMFMERFMPQGIGGP